MKQVLQMTCPVIPVPQPRQRHVVAKSGKVVNYTPDRHPVQAFKDALRYSAIAKIRTPIDGPLHLIVHFYLPRPARLMRRWDPDGLVPHTAKPDADNLLKAVKDALNKLVWRDDSQIYLVTAGKWYAGKQETPRVELMLYAQTE